MRILIFGDSITYGVSDSKGGWAERLRMTPVFEETDHSVYPLGISGDTTTGVLKRFEIESQARFHDEKSFIVIAIGTNDGQYLRDENRERFSNDEFTRNYEELIGLAKRHAGVLILGLPIVDEAASKTVSDTKSFPEAKNKELNKIIQNLATKHSIPFVDMQQLFERNGGTSLLSDGLHPNTRGHELIYQEVCKQLRDILHI